MSTCCSLLPDVETAACASSSMAGVPGGRAAEREIAAHRDQRTADAPFRQDGDRFARRVALANRADVERHPADLALDRFLRIVEVQLAESAARGCFLARRGVGDAAGLARLAPEPDHRTLRDVERAVGRLGESLRRLQ